MKYYELMNYGTEKLLKVNKTKNSAFNEARLLMLYALKIKPEKLAVKYRDKAGKKTVEKFIHYISQRLKRIPLQYITGESSFYGRTFKTSRGVLIPRQDSEALVNAVKKLKIKPGTLAADAGSGSGNLCVTLMLECRNINRMYAYDINSKAVELTLLNAKRYRVRGIKCIKKDFFASKIFKFGLVVSNPPYIKTKDMYRLQEEVKKEPENALASGPDGLKFYRKFAANKGRYMEKGGFLVLEAGDKMVTAVIKLFKNKWKYLFYEQDYTEKKRGLVFQYKGN